MIVVYWLMCRYYGLLEKKKEIRLKNSRLAFFLNNIKIQTNSMILVEPMSGLNI
jgi:hypothetical protein